MSLILFGFKRCGKTTYGKLLAQKLQLPFVDTDQLIEKIHGETCSQIVSNRGVESFRHLESQVVLSLSALKRQVIALGAGALLSPLNLLHLQQIGQLVYLQLDRHTLQVRLSTPPFPYYIDPDRFLDSFHAIYSERIPQYEMIPATVVDLKDKNQEEILWQLTDLATSSVLRHGENLMAKQ